jgi:peptidoglycan-associated lipoprotein
MSESVNMTRVKWIALVLFVFAVAAGCRKAPLEEIGAAEAALRAARDAGAPDCAPKEFQSAEEMMARTYRFNDDREFGPAKDAAVTTKQLADIARIEAGRSVQDGCQPGTAAAEGRGAANDADADGVRLRGTRMSEADVAREIEATRRGEGALGDGTLVAGLKPVHFGFDDSSLSPEALQIIQANAGWLEDRPSVKIQIEGHTDDRGTAEYNLALGERRAKAVRDALVRLGVATNRIALISYGEEVPVAMGADEASWAENRRAEFVVK